MSSDAGAEETIAIVLRPGECAIGRFRLQVTSGPDRGLERVSQGEELSVGTAPGNDLVLTDRSVSRHHFTVRVTEGGFHVRDLGSRNGTKLGGYRVESAYLTAGATLAIGESTLRFETLSDEITLPLSREESFSRLLGQSTAMRRLFASMPRIAASDSTVLIEGETGTGKGLVAEAIHAQSPRGRGPLVVIDCSAIPPNLIETELFGHARGAFTGAHSARPGAFEAAAGGTVFLDEIGELPLDMQPKLLRALEERVVRRVGSLDPVRLDVRVIAATNRDLRQEVNRGAFRSDLYYRLNIVRIRLPPLRERREDIPMLVAHFYEQFVRTGDPRPPEGLIARLAEQPWPGNVRELRAAVERAVLLQDLDFLSEAPSDPAPVRPAEPARAADTDYAGDLAIGSFRTAKERVMTRWESGYIEALVKKSGGNVSRAARMARMDRNHLRELVRRYAIKVVDD